MIQIDDVTPTARELRPIKRGWGWVHWTICLPSIALMAGFLAMGVSASVMADYALPPMFLTLFLIATVLLWLIAMQIAQRTLAREAARAPTNGLGWRWTIDDTGFVFESALQRNSLDWRAVKAIRQEKDRIIFLVTPASNPVLPKRLLNAEQEEALQALIDRATTSGRLGAGVD